MYHVQEVERYWSVIANFSHSTCRPIAVHLLFHLTENPSEFRYDIR